MRQEDLEPHQQWMNYVGNLFIEALWEGRARRQVEGRKLVSGGVNMRVENLAIFYENMNGGIFQSPSTRAHIDMPLSLCLCASVSPPDNKIGIEFLVSVSRSPDP
ncbi:hypothetical protein E2C01_045506 [Portunus trituberculatus]|uniref:Uncharacterized protein n=1 Tax=Portunus trituberculatus TaxID=210409 RepID=A0A5B7G584_PORTR|nr:hypothetical protein [Portunus trituberculatus]